MPTDKPKPAACTLDDCRTAHAKFVARYNQTPIQGPFNCRPVTTTQFRVYYTNEQGEKDEFKPKAHRMWFYTGDANLEAAVEDHQKFTVSHLCHTGKCIEPSHLVLEDLATNKSRNVCPGPGTGSMACNHEPLCLRAGHQYQPDCRVGVWRNGSMVVVSKADL